MSTAKDIFDAIIDSDNVNLLDIVKNGLYDRANQKLEDYKKEVGGRLFKEEMMPANGIKKPIVPITNTQNNTTSSTNQNQQNNTQNTNQKAISGNPIKKNNQLQINT